MEAHFWHLFQGRNAVFGLNLKLDINLPSIGPDLFLLTHLKFLFNGGLDPEVAEPAELRKRRTLAGSAIVLSPIALMLVISNLFYSAAEDNPAILSGIAIILASLYIQACANRPVFATWLALFAYYVVPTMLMSRHGIVSTPLLWMLPIPPIATLLLGIRTGGAFASLCVCTFAALWWLDSAGIISPDTPGRAIAMAKYGQDTVAIYAFEASLVLGILTLATMVFRHFQAGTETKLTETVESLQRENKIRMQAEQAAKDSEFSKLAFLAAMGHELRTPLNGVIGASRLLQNSDSVAEKQEFTKVILSSSETLLELINNVLDLSSLESGKMKLEQVPFNLRDFIAQTVDLFRFQAASKGLDFIVDLSSDCPANVVGDPTRLRQVLINLIGNAIKFTESGSVSVVLGVKEGKLLLSVSDTGIGVSGEAQKLLFEPYVQAETATNRKYGGSGLGLAIVRKIVTAMGGEIQIESALGEGASFCVTLPIAEIEAEIAETASTPVTDLPTLRTLVVDDNAVNRMVLSRLLEKDRHEVVAVNDGKQALEYATNNEVDIILMDIQMPEMDGFTAARTIRASQGPCKNAPIIAITANFNKSDRDSSTAAGMDGFLSKPFRYEELLQVLQEAMAARR